MAATGRTTGRSLSQRREASWRAEGGDQAGLGAWLDAEIESERPELRTEALGIWMLGMEVREGDGGGRVGREVLDHRDQPAARHAAASAAGLGTHQP